MSPRAMPDTTATADITGTALLTTGATGTITTMGTERISTGLTTGIGQETLTDIPTDMAPAITGDVTAAERMRTIHPHIRNEKAC